MTQWGLDTLFNPAKRHMDEEKRRLQSTREEVGDSSGGKRIDLESGKVTIQREAGDESDNPEPGGVAAEEAKSVPDDESEQAPAASEETAADRARARRARQRARQRPQAGTDD